MASVKGQKKGVWTKDAHKKVFKEHHGFSPDWKNKREVIHHIDGNHDNNDISNLTVITQGEHIKLHNPNLGRKYTEEHRKKLSEARKGNQNAKGHKHDKQTLQTLSEQAKVWWGSKEGLLRKEKLKIGGIKHTEDSKKKMSENKKEWWKKRKENANV